MPHTRRRRRRAPSHDEYEQQGRIRSGWRGRTVRVVGLVLGGILAASVLLVLSLRWLPPPTSAFMLQHYFAADSNSVRYQWVDWESISPYVPLAAVAAEDQTFPAHWGFDIKSIAKALDDQQDGGRLRGASTITQQVAKNLFLWPGRSFVRKGLEAYFTALIELLWPKQRILEVYVNIAEFGTGTYGVHAASLRYFGKSPSELGLREAARLAAVLPNPKVLDVSRPSPYVMERRFWIEGQMERLGGPGYLQRL